MNKRQRRRDRCRRITEVDGEIDHGLVTSGREVHRDYIKKLCASWVHSALGQYDSTSTLSREIVKIYVVLGSSIGSWCSLVYRRFYSNFLTPLLIGAASLQPLPLSSFTMTLHRTKRQNSHYHQLRHSHGSSCCFVCISLMETMCER